MSKTAYNTLVLLDNVWRKRYLIVIPILIFPFIGLIVGLVSPKQYTSHSTILVQETAKMNPSLVDYAVSSQMKERFKGLQILLHSRHILSKVAKDHGLIEETSTRSQIDNVIDKLSDNLSMTAQSKNVIRINYSASNDKEMKEILSSVSHYVIDEFLAPEQASMKNSHSFLTNHIEFRREELNKAEADFVNFRNKNIDALPEIKFENINKIEKLKQTMFEKKAERASYKKNLEQLDQQLSLTNPVIGGLEKQIVKVRSELSLLKARYTEQHSLVQGALQHLNQLEEKREHLLSSTDKTINTNTLWDIASSAALTHTPSPPSLLTTQLEKLQLTKNKLSKLKEEISSLKKMINQLEQRVTKAKGKEQEILKLERDLDVKHHLFQELLTLHEKARLTYSLGSFGEEERIKIIEEPYTPTGPSNHSLLRFFAGGLWGGILFGCGATALLIISNITIRYSARLEAISGVPVLSRIPPIKDTHPAY